MTKMERVKLIGNLLHAVADAAQVVKDLPVADEWWAKHGDTIAFARTAAELSADVLLAEATAAAKAARS